MSVCRSCGAKFEGNECPDCGSKNFSEDEDFEFEIFGNSAPAKKKSTFSRICSSIFSFFFISVFVLLVFMGIKFIDERFFSNEISYEEAVERVSLGMSESEVRALFGEPYKVDEKNGYWYYYEDKFKEKYLKYQEKLDKAEDDIEKSYELYEKMEGKKTKLLRIAFTGAEKKVDEIIFDNEHSFNEIASTIPVKFTLGEYEKIEIINGIVAIYDEETKTFKFQRPGTYWLYDYKATFENGSFIIDSLDGERLAKADKRPEDDLVEFDWEKNLRPSVYGSSKTDVVKFLDVKIPISLISLSKNGNLTVDKGVTVLKNSYTDGFEDKIKSITLPESIKIVENNFFAYLPNLTTVNLAKNTDSVYEEDGVVYYYTEKIPYTRHKNPDIESEFKIIWLNNERLPEVLKIKEGIEVIGPEFDNKTKLIELQIPASVDDIETYFVGCSSLRKVTAHEDNEYFSVDNEILYYKPPHMGMLHYYRTVFVPRDYKGKLNLKYKAALGQLEGRSKITSLSGEFVAEGTLAGCSSLEKLRISGLADMKLGEFFGTEEYAGSVATVQNGVTYYIPKNLSEFETTNYIIKEGTFENCSNIKKVTIDYVPDLYSQGSSYLQIEKRAFVGCTSLERVIFPEGKYKFVKDNKTAEMIYFTDDLSRDIVRDLQGSYSDCDFYITLNSN